MENILEKTCNSTGLTLFDKIKEVQKSPEYELVQQIGELQEVVATLAQGKKVSKKEIKRVLNF